MNTETENTTCFTEEWRPIVGFEGLYEVSCLGNVRRVAPGHRTRPGKILAKNHNNYGYVTYTLIKDHHNYCRAAHKLVAEAFIPNPDPDNFTDIDHIDNDKENNAVWNLQWLSHRDNMQKYYELYRKIKASDEYKEILNKFLNEEK